MNTGFGMLAPAVDLPTPSTPMSIIFGGNLVGPFLIFDNRLFIFASLGFGC
jgi:hypothetical protein